MNGGIIGRLYLSTFLGLYVRNYGDLLIGIMSGYGPSGLGRNYCRRRYYCRRARIGYCIPEGRNGISFNRITIYIKDKIIGVTRTIRSGRDGYKTCTLDWLSRRKIREVRGALFALTYLPFIVISYVTRRDPEGYKMSARTRKMGGLTRGMSSGIGYNIIKDSSGRARTTSSYASETCG